MGSDRPQAASAEYSISLFKDRNRLLVTRSDCLQSRELACTCSPARVPCVGAQ